VLLTALQAAGFILITSQSLKADCLSCAPVLTLQGGLTAYGFVFCGSFWLRIIKVEYDTGFCDA